MQSYVHRLMYANVDLCRPTYLDLYRPICNYSGKGNMRNINLKEVRVTLHKVMCRSTMLNKEQSYDWFI